jgi:isopentenyl diphosphate isomerase/L-lactate dehydrogenase-like FMN-dependent dehydrogenase
VKRNKDIFNEILVNPSVCVDVGVIDGTTTVLGHKISSPIGLAPMGF